MKTMLHRLVIALGMLALSTLPAQSKVLQTCFTPQQNCTAMIISRIDDAKREVLVQAYIFTSCPILESLVHAKNRGVNVRILLDKTNEQKRYAGYSAYLRANGVEPKIDPVPGGIAHKKTIVIDHRLLITGSLNPTPNSQRSVNAVYFIIGKAVRQEESHWWQRAAGSRLPHITPVDANPRCGLAGQQTRSPRNH